jgi:hypothetical protein
LPSKNYRNKKNSSQSVISGTWERESHPQVALWCCASLISHGGSPLASVGLTDGEDFGVVWGAWTRGFVWRWKEEWKDL